MRDNSIHFRGAITPEPCRTTIRTKKGAHDPEKLALDLIRGGHRFSDKIMRHEKKGSGAPIGAPSIVRAT